MITLGGIHDIVQRNKNGFKERDFFHVIHVIRPTMVSWGGSSVFSTLHPIFSESNI